MATIALYGMHTELMPMRMEELERSISDYDQELFSLKTQVLTIDRNVCNMEDVTGLIQKSTLMQERAVSSVETIDKEMEEFIGEAIVVDHQVAELVNQQKDDFYSKYRYLKPGCEKDFWEKAIDKAHSVGEWCKEHWKATVTIVLVGVLVAAIFMCPVTAAYLLFAAKTVGLTLLGGVIGGSLRALTGGSFWEGFEDGAFGGILGALLFGGIAGGNTALTFVQLMKAAGMVGGSVSLIGDIGDVLIKGEDISLGQMIQHAVVSAAFSMAFAAVFYGIGKAISALRPQPVGEGTGGGSSAEGGAEPGTLSDVEARQWYLEQEAKIPNMIDDSLPLEQQAKQAFELRNQFRTQARELMSNRQLAESLNITDPNLTWEQIIQKQIDKGLTGDDIYKAIIESAQRSRTSVNQLLGLE